MTLYERLLFGLSTSNHNGFRQPKTLDEHEARRHTFAEERTGQIIVNEPGLGYVALSTLYEAKTILVDPPEAATSAMPDQMLQLPLFEPEE